MLISALRPFFRSRLSGAAQEPSPGDMTDDSLFLTGMGPEIVAGVTANFSENPRLDIRFAGSASLCSTAVTSDPGAAI